MTLNWQFPEAGLIADQKLRTSLNHTVNISLLLKLSAHWSQRSCETCFFGLEEEKNKTAMKIMFSMKKQHRSFNSSFLLLWFSKRLESIAEMITGGNYRFMFLMSEWIYTQKCHLPFHILQKIRHTCFLHQQKSLKINFFFRRTNMHILLNTVKLNRTTYVIAVGVSFEFLAPSLNTCG